MQAQSWNRDEITPPRFRGRQEGVSYLLGDHLGSTSLTTDADAGNVIETRYKAFGETRFSYGTMPTKYTFTGQYSYTDDPSTPGVTEGFGLMFFNARWMDPSLGRFAQPDSIVPTQTQGTQAWDRFAYVSNNPVRNNDPSGHMVDKDDGGSQYDPSDSCVRLGYNSPECRQYLDLPESSANSIDKNTTVESLLLDNPKFDPFGCKYSGASDCIYPGSESEEYDLAFLDLYKTLGIDIDYYASRGLPNPLDVNLVPSKLQQNLPIAANNHPILLFFIELEKITGNNLYLGSNKQTFMNYEANYVFRLMVGHPQALIHAIDIYNSLPPGQRDYYDNMDNPGL